MLSAFLLTQQKLRIQGKDIPGGPPERRGHTTELEILLFSLVDVGSAFSWATLSGKVHREAKCMAKLGAVCVPGLSLMPFLLSSKLLLALKNMLW